MVGPLLGHCIDHKPIPHGGDVAARKPPKAQPARILMDQLSVDLMLTVYMKRRNVGFLTEMSTCTPSDFIAQTETATLLRSFTTSVILK